MFLTCNHFAVIYKNKAESLFTSLPPFIIIEDLRIYRVFFTHSIMLFQFLQILCKSSFEHSWYLILYTQILFSSTNLYLPGPFPLTLCIICVAFIAFMIQQHLLELGDINDASGVFFVIKRLGVVIIINNRLVQNRFPVVIHFFLQFRRTDTLRIREKNQISTTLT